MALQSGSQAEETIYSCRELKRAARLYRSGDAFNSIYFVRRGFFKTLKRRGDGRAQVTGFFMSGELLGMDGIAPNIYTCDAVALQDSEACVFSYVRLAEFSRRNESVQRQFHKAMGSEIERVQGLVALLGTRRAEERIALFLLNLSQRFAARGYSPTEFVLPMTRDDIGSYLGLTIETVSRMLAMFQGAGLIRVESRHIQIRDSAGLRQTAGWTHSTK